MSNTTNNIYYVYGHYRNDTDTLFYVGKGKNKRAWDKNGRNKYWKNIVSKHGYTVFIFYKDLTEKEAYSKEIGLILDLNPKANLTSGGEGGNFYIKKTKDEIDKILIKKSNSMKGKNTGKNNGMFGYIYTDDLKLKKSILTSGEKHPQFGKPRSLQTKEKIKHSLKYTMKSVICINTKEIFDSISQCAKYFNINKSNLCRALKGKRKTLKGLTFEFV